MRMGTIQTIARCKFEAMGHYDDWAGRAQCRFKSGLQSGRAAVQTWSIFPGIDL